MKFDPALVAFSLFSFSLLRSRDPSLRRLRRLKGISFRRKTLSLSLPLYLEIVGHKFLMFSREARMNG